MSLETSRSASSPPVPAWIALGATLIAEYLLVSYLVDARDVLAPAGLERVLGGIGELAPLSFVFLAAVVLTGGSTIRVRLRSLSLYRDDRRWAIVWGAMHACAFAAVLGLGLAIKAFEGVPAASARLWVSLWFGAVAISVVALGATCWSPKTFLGALAGLRRELSIGLLVGFVAWGSGLLAQKLWKPLAWLTLELVHAVLTVLTPDPVASIEHALVGTSRFYVEVAPVCSGIEGVGLMLTFVGAYLYLQRRELRWPLSFALLPLSALLVWFLNVVRVTGLIAVGTWGSPQVALGGFHSKAGWVFFTLSAMLTVVFVQRSKTFRRARSEGDHAVSSRPHDAGVEGGSSSRAASRSASLPAALGHAKAPAAARDAVARDAAARDAAARDAAAGDPASRDATVAYLGPMLAVLAAKLLTGLATSGFDSYYPVSVAAAILVLWKYRSHYPRFDWSSPWVALGVGGAVSLVWIVGFSRSGTPSLLGEELAALPPPLAGFWLTARAFGTIVTIPIVEELAFRGYLLRRFVSSDFSGVSYRRFSWLGLLVSSVAFGVLHSQWGLGIVAGLAFGGLVVFRGRLQDAILAHATANAVIVAYVFITGDWALLG